MIRFLTAFLVLGFLVSPSWAQVYLSETAIENLENFENYRSKTCVKRSLSKKKWNSEQDFFPIDFTKNKWPRYEHTQTIGSLVCPLDYSMTYLKPQISKYCEKDAELVSPFCSREKEFEENPNGEQQFLFSQDFSSLMGREEFYPWQLVESQNGPANFAALTLVQKGNIFLKITLLLSPAPKKQFSEGAGEQLKKDFEKFGFQMEDENNFYFPFIRFDISLSGVSKRSFYIEIYREDVPFFGRTLEEDQALSHHIIFSETPREDFLNSDFFVLKAFASEKKKNLLAEIKIPNDQFKRILAELNAHYQSLSIP